MYTAGIVDTILGGAERIMSDFGIGVDSAEAVARAYASPTVANINAVTAAFQAEGNTPPPELINSLWQRYYSSIAHNPYATSGALTGFLSNPLVIAGGIGLLIFAFSRKR